MAKTSEREGPADDVDVLFKSVRIGRSDLRQIVAVFTLLDKECLTPSLVKRAEEIGIQIVRARPELQA